MSVLKTAVSALTINTPDLEKSLAVYKLLGFKEVMRADWPFPWIQVSDGVLLIMLRKDDKPYIAITYYVSDLDSVITELMGKGIIFSSLPTKKDMLKRAVTESPDGMTVTFVATPGGFKQPGGKTMAQMSPQDMGDPAKYPNKAIGMFGELAQPVTALAKSLQFWQALGYDKVSQFDAPYPWAIATDGRMVVGLHQTTEFSKPAITYFATNMVQKVAALRKKGLAGISDTMPGHAHLATPEGQTFFLYSMGAPSEATAQTGPEEFTVRAIARVRNSRNEPIDDNWGSITSEIELEADIPESALNAIEDFSHLEILYFFDQVPEDTIIFSGRPRGNPKYPDCGIFAQRKKDRPNRIGLCTVELVGRKGKVLVVRNLDAIDGTPVLDIKPVFKEYRTEHDIRQPEWVGDLMKEYWVGGETGKEKKPKKSTS